MELFNSLDITLTIAILFLGWHGFFSGFFKEMSISTILILGIFIFSYISNSILFGFNDSFFKIETQKELDIYGYTLTFFLFSIFLWFSYGFLSDISVNIKITIIDQFLGFIFASIKGFFILSFVLYFLFSISEIRISYKNEINKSYIIKKMLVSADYIFHIKQQEDNSKKRNTSYITEKNTYDDSEDNGENLNLDSELND